MINRYQKVNLQHLVNRINNFNHFAEKHPEKKEYFERKIEETNALIVKAVLQNDGKHALTDITLR